MHPVTEHKILHIINTILYEVLICHRKKVGFYAICKAARELCSHPAWWCSGNIPISKVVLAASKEASRCMV